MERKGTKVLTIVGLFIVAMFATMPSAQALQDMRITSYNLNSLQNWGTWIAYGSGELLKWEGYPSILDVTCQKQLMVGTIRAVSVADNQCNVYGQCPSFAKALSKSNVATGSWVQGSKVMSSNLIQAGTVIATFNSASKYEAGHVAIFRDYAYSNGQRTGILVWDQNYIPDHGGAVARHSIRAKGTTWLTDPNNANNYYVVRLP